MEIVEKIDDMRCAVADYRRRSAGRVGLVPTMGYLHQGHASLMEQAREQCGLVVVSIFVNPLQFGPNEDFERYPRDPERDRAIASAAGADLLFMPTVAEMYPQFPLKTKVNVGEITGVLCGLSRPGHFDGVAAIVAKLFHIVKPDRAFFGLKDAQQVAVIRQMAADLNFDVDIVPCPIVREADGLAMSSRNVYLSGEERSQATVLNRSLRRAEELIRAGDHTLGDIRREMEAMIGAVPLARIEYIEILHYPELSPPDPRAKARDLRPERELIVALAVKFGNTRLIDNRIIS